MKKTPIEARPRKERIDVYRKTARFYQDLADALRERGEPSEAVVLGEIARRFKGLEAHVRRAVEMETACCWQSVSFGTCGCADVEHGRIQ